jgi:response regulator RpfG family c-di-GMP phosphodiesterase
LKVKLLKAFIIDNNPDQARMMNNLVKEIFTKIYIQTDPILAIRELSEIRPQVIFLNLSIAQRSLNFEIIEKISPIKDQQTVIFGYNDSFEGELLAHAIETGIHDIFVRPFDPDIISTKVSRFFQSEKTDALELQYSPLIHPIKTSVKMNLKLKGVDENGLTFKSDHYISKGTIFPLKNDLIKEIFETENMEMMITKTWLGDGMNDFYIFAEPRVAREQHNASLRKFILRKL